MVFQATQEISKERNAEDKKEVAVMPKTKDGNVIKSFKEQVKKQVMHASKR